MEINRLNSEQLERMIVKLTSRLLDSEEKRQSAEENAAYWYQRYIGLEGNAHVQGVPVEPASAGVPGSAGGGAGAVPGMR